MGVKNCVYVEGGGGGGVLHVSKERGWYQEGGMKKERGADTPFCIMYSESVSKKNLALHLRRNSCPGTTLIFFGF